jgi:hypothetical protein
VDIATHLLDYVYHGRFAQFVMVFFVVNPTLKFGDMKIRKCSGVRVVGDGFRSVSAP